MFDHARQLTSDLRWLEMVLEDELVFLMTCHEAKLTWNAGDGLDGAITVRGDVARTAEQSSIFTEINVAADRQKSLAWRMGREAVLLFGLDLVLFHRPGIGNSLSCRFLLPWGNRRALMPTKAPEPKKPSWYVVLPKPLVDEMGHRPSMSPLCLTRFTSGLTAAVGGGHGQGKPAHWLVGWATTFNPAETRSLYLPPLGSTLATGLGPSALSSKTKVQSADGAKKCKHSVQSPDMS